MPHRPVQLALVWHMHQPYYKDMRTGKHVMPWVRLHATKDYVDMVELLREFPKVRCTFNLVPSLLEQVEELASGETSDMVWDLTVRPANALNDGEKQFLLSKFFACHYDNMIKPYPRYRQLFEQRGWAKTEAEMSRAAQYFSEQDWRDLQVWYNLTWIDPLHFERNAELQALVNRGRDFSEADKHAVLNIHRELLKRVVPAYREAMERGQVEVTCSPYYHPILPLIWDTNLARIARPDLPLPAKRFSQPQDARQHVELAIQQHERLFGQRPRGMWPSEGSVAPEILPLLAEYGIEWIATDEEVLAASTGEPIRRSLAGVLDNPQHLYGTWAAEHSGARLSMIFRDHFLSDLIGFQYAGWRAEDAATDLVRRLEEVARTAQSHQPGVPLLIPIILDGENCWEHYFQDGLPFLRHLYRLLSDNELIGTTRVIDFIDQYPTSRTLPRLHAGSWINHDFRVWIGHQEDNTAWDYLSEVREMVHTQLETNRETLDGEKACLALKELLIAEGSDWNWWYGDEHNSGIDDEFDQLYRDHLMNACLLVGVSPPPYLRIPIKKSGTSAVRVREPRALLHPSIDGRNTTYYEWFAAGHYDPTTGGTSMHQAMTNLRGIYWGFDRKSFFFRVDVDRTLLRPAQNEDVDLVLHLVQGDDAFRVTVNIPCVRDAWDETGTDSFASSMRLMAAKPTVGHAGVCAVLERIQHGRRHTQRETGPVAVDQCVEVALPFEEINASPEVPVLFYAALEVNGREIERCPANRPIQTAPPTPDFETKMWMV